jgi:hypothetical protein
MRINLLPTSVPARFGLRRAGAVRKRSVHEKWQWQPRSQRHARIAPGVSQLVVNLLRQRFQHFHHIVQGGSAGGPAHLPGYLPRSRKRQQLVRQITATEA